MKGKAQKCICILLALLWWPTAVLAQGWTQTSAPQANWSGVASSADGTRLWAAVNGGRIYTSADSGQTWSPSGAPATNWSCIACSADGSHIVAAGATGPSPIYCSADYGAHWLARTVPDLAYLYYGWSCVASSADGTVLLALPGLNGIPLYGSTNAGTDWLELGSLRAPTGYRRTWVALSADGFRTAIASGNAATSGVETWTNLTAYAEAGYAWFGNWLCTPLASSADGMRLFTLARYAAPGMTDCLQKLLTSSDAGQTWQQTCEPVVSNLTAVALSSDGTRAVAVGEGDVMFMTSNGGLQWQTANMPKGYWVSVASSADGTKLVAAMRGGGLYTWPATPTPKLNGRPDGANLSLSWCNAYTTFVAQESPDLTPASWVDVTNAPQPNATNFSYEVSVPSQSGSHFYRLVQRNP